MAAIAAKVAGHFDTYICHRDDNLRDRGPDEIPQLMRALIAEGVAPDAITIVEEENKALDAALSQAITRRFGVVLLRSDHTQVGGRSFTSRRNSRADRSPVAKRLAASDFSIPDGFVLTSDDRGVPIVRRK